MTSSCGPEIFGADPVSMQWTIVRGDTSPLRVEFYQNDETTHTTLQAGSIPQVPMTSRAM